MACGLLWLLGPCQLSMATGCCLIRNILVTLDYITRVLRLIWSILLSAANLERHERVHLRGIDDILYLDESLHCVGRALAWHPKSRRGNAHFVKNIDVAPHTGFGRAYGRRRGASDDQMRIANGIDQRLDIVSFIAFARHETFDGAADADGLYEVAQFPLDLIECQRRRPAHINIDAASFRRRAGLVGRAGPNRADTDLGDHFADRIFDRVLSLVFYG